MSWLDLPVVGDIASGLIGGAAGYFGQESANRTNLEIAQRQMDFQREMSSTSWQRGVKDMRLAGINPMLAYSQGGASSPGGAGIPVGNSGAAAVQGASSAINSYNSSRSTSAQNAMLNQQTTNLKQTQGQIMANTAAAYAQAQATTAQSALYAANTQVALANAKSVHIDNALKTLAIPQATNSAAKASTWFGKNVTPYINDVLGNSILDSITKIAK